MLPPQAALERDANDETDNVASAAVDGTAGFSAAPAFDGARAGYVFKMGPLGLGYYRDLFQAATAL